MVRSPTVESVTMLWFGMVENGAVRHGVAALHFMAIEIIHSYPKRFAMRYRTFSGMVENHKKKRLEFTS